MVLPGKKGIAARQNRIVKAHIDKQNRLWYTFTNVRNQIF